MKRLRAARRAREARPGAWARLVFTAACVAGVGAGVAGAGPAHAENLLEVYAQARAADPTLAGVAAQRGVQVETAVQARAALLPQWQVSASDARSQFDGSHSRQAQSSLSQAIFDLGHLRSWQAEALQTSAQDASLRAAEQDLCARVAQAYFGVLLAQASLATTQANEAAYAAQVTQSKARFKLGLAAQVDAEQASAYYELARGSTLQARQTLDDARQALAQITGHLPGELKPLAPDLPALPPDPEDPQAWVDRAMQTNPGVRALDLTLAASQRRIDAARAGHWPVLSAGLTTLRAGGPGVDSLQDGRNVTQVSVQLSLPLFSGGAIDSQVRQAQYQRDSAADTLESARRAAVRETRAEYQAVMVELRLMQSTRAAVEAADRALASTRTGQTLGTRSNTDLLLAIQTQTTAQSANDQARHAYVLARLLLLQAAGELNEAGLAAANALLQ